MGQLLSVLKLIGVISGASKEFRYHCPLCLSIGKNSARGKMIDKKWFIGIGWLWGLQVGGREKACPRTYWVTYSFRIKGEVRRGKIFLCLFWDVMLPSSAPLPGGSWHGSLGMGVLLSLHGHVRSTNNCFSCVQRACLRDGIITYWAYWAGCGFHTTTVLLFWDISCFYWRRRWHPHSSSLAWKIPWTEESGRLQSMRSLRVGHDWETSLSLSCIGEGNGNPLHILAWRIPGTGELVGCHLWGRTGSDRTEAT